MKAINNYVVVKKIKEEPKKIAGLIITEKTDEEGRYYKGIVVSVGDIVKGVSDGDTVHYDKHAEHAITWKDEVYFVIKSSDIVLIDN